MRSRRDFDATVASRIPGVAGLAGAFDRLANVRHGRIPVGLLALIPVALIIDLFDAADELALGPIGMGLSFILESAFLLGLTGRASYAFGFAAIDLIPLVDLLPLATITLAREIGRAWAKPRQPTKDRTTPPRGPIIDV